MGIGGSIARKKREVVSVWVEIGWLSEAESSAGVVLGDLRTTIVCDGKRMKVDEVGNKYEEGEALFLLFWCLFLWLLWLWTFALFALWLR